MVITHVNEQTPRQLQEVADILGNAKKVVVVCGAGISTNCGVPVWHALFFTPVGMDAEYDYQDFRSKDGLYNLIQNVEAASCAPSPRRTSPRKRTIQSYAYRVSKPAPKLKAISGKDLFQSSVWAREETTFTFYRFIASLKSTIDEQVSAASATHRFIRLLRDQGRLVRCYTQNIDGLEAREGLSSDIAHGKGSRSRFTKKAISLALSAGQNLRGTIKDAGCEAIQLHGSLENVKCTICSHVTPWKPCHSKEKFLRGTAPECPSCLETSLDRENRGMRGTCVGTLRPDIVLYGEGNRHAEDISKIMHNDLGLKPDVLLILGTSLQVHGLKALVRDFAQTVHAKKSKRAKVIFVNLTAPASSVWNDVIDYWVGMDCDRWVEDLKHRIPNLFRLQQPLTGRVTKMAPKTAIATETTPKKRSPGRPRKIMPVSSSSPVCPKTIAPLSPTMSAAAKCSPIPQNLLNPTPTISPNDPVRRRLFASTTSPPTTKRKRSIDFLEEVAQKIPRIEINKVTTPTRPIQFLTPPSSRRHRTRAVSKGYMDTRSTLIATDLHIAAPPKVRKFMPMQVYDSEIGNDESLDELCDENLDPQSPYKIVDRNNLLYSSPFKRTALRELARNMVDSDSPRKSRGKHSAKNASKKDLATSSPKWLRNTAARNRPEDFWTEVEGEAGRERLSSIRK
ncbi:hypothetical protein MMC25_003197 [Agyrium rufum]|nr:hypothetical protein [Agyrium rufum]